MASTSFIQDSFHGGEWSKNFQGRSTDKGYKTAMNVCFNGLPIEEGAWVRRPGTRLAAPTYKGLPGKILPIAMETTASYDIEFTDGNIRFFNGGIPVFTEEVTLVNSISEDNPAELSTSTPVQWNDGDEIVFFFDNTTTAVDSSLILRNRVIKIKPVPMTINAWDATITYNINAVVSFGGNNYQAITGNNLNLQPDTNPTNWEVLPGTPANVYQLFDSITGVGIDGADVDFSAGGIFVLRLLRLSSPYSSSAWNTNRLVQYEDTSFILNGAVQPQQLTISPNSGDALFAIASITPTYFEDGPYLDVLPDSKLTISDQSGIITIVAAFLDYDAAKTYDAGRYANSGGASYRSLVDANIGHTPASSPTFWKLVSLGTAVTGENVPVVGFQQKDVGRHVRFFSSPTPYDAASTFTFGENVFYNGQSFQNVSGSSLTGVQPDTNPDKWTLNPTGSAWAWGKITAVSGPTVASVQIIPMPDTVVGDAGYQIMYPATLPVLKWRLGVYSDAVGWPANGALHEGRLWLGGVVQNRFDASAIQIDGKLTGFSPTLPDGTVTDASGISYTLLATEKNQIFWFSPEEKGIVVGTLAGEWLIQSSSAGDPLTPTSIQAKRVTKYGCANIEPRRTGIALIFVHKFVRKMFEFITDVWTSKYIAPNLNKKSKHITTTGLAELAYQEELAPILWARLNDGSFVGTTYRRENSSVTDDPTFNGFHRHTLATGRTCDGIISGPSADGKLDTISMLTTDPTVIGTSGGLNQQVRWVEVMTDIFDEKDSLYDAWFVDGGMVPSSMYEDTVSSELGVYFTGLFYLKGQTVAVFGGGLDLGDYVVDDFGRVFVPYGTGIAPALIDYTQSGAGHYLFTAAYVAAVMAVNFVPKNGGIFTATGSPTISLGNPVDAPLTTTIQSFVPTNAFAGESLPVALSATGVMVSWPDPTAPSDGYVTMFSANPSKGLRSFDITTGSQTSFVTWATLGFTNPVVDAGCAFTDPAEGVHTLGFVAGNSNFNPVIEVEQVGLTLLNSFNRTSTIGGGSAAGAVAAGGLSGVKANGLEAILDAGIVGERVDLIDPQGALLTNGAMIQEGNTDEGNTQFCTIVSSNTTIGAHITSYGGGTGTVFGYYGVLHTIINGVQGSFLGHKMDLNSKKGKGKKKISIDQVDLFTPSQSGADYRNIKKIGVINPSQVNAAWSHFTSVGGMTTDYTDLGSIVLVQNTHDRLAQLYHSASQAGVWSSLTTYNLDDVPVSKATTGSNTNIYLTKTNGNLNNSPTNNPADANWRYYSTSTAPTWLVGTTYGQYDIVEGSDNKFYRSNAAANIGTDPTTVGQTAWTLLVQGYALGELVIASDGQIYESLVTDNDNHQPTFNTHPAQWKYSVLQAQYVIKLAPEAPTVLWAVPVNSGRFESNITQNSFCAAGIFIHMGTLNDVGSGLSGSYPVYIIDTTTGAYKVASVKGIASPGYSCTHGFNYQIMVQINEYDSTVTGAPTPLNATVSWNTGGGAVSNWALLTIGSDLAQSPIPSTSSAFPTRRPIINFIGVPTGQFPCAVGHAYTSQGQILRLIDQQELKSQQGPATADTRRTHYVQALLTNAIGVQFGTDFTKMELAVIKDDFGKQMTPIAMYSGVHRHTLKDGYSYDSMLAWTVTRPYPVTIANVGGKAKTQGT